MTIVAGIDEAGYGPLLGPLVVSVTAFRVPDHAANADLWQLFERGIAPCTSRAKGKVRVGDSKALHKSGKGLRPLEENVLPFIALTGGTPPDLHSFLERHCNSDINGLASYPWYCDDPPLPRESQPADIAERAANIRRTFDQAGAGFCAARFELLDVVAFNREVNDCGKKSVALARRTGALMHYLWEEFGEQGITLFVDKQGGRNRYGGFLSGNFPFCSIATLVESAERSAYVIAEGRRRIHVSFEPKADDTHLPTALASMLSKYTRELFVEMLNAFWTQRVAGLKSTAGYVTDGRRFLAEIESARSAEGIGLDLLVRCR